MVTKRERMDSFVLAGNRRLTISPCSDPVCIWVSLYLPWQVGCTKVRFCSSGFQSSTEDCSAFQKSTRDDLQGWDALLLVYATLFVPVVFSLMVGTNILVWTKLRINHTFIFGECCTTSKPASRQPRGS